MSRKPTKHFILYIFIGTDPKPHERKKKLGLRVKWYFHFFVQLFYFYRELLFNNFQIKIRNS